MNKVLWAMMDITVKCLMMMKVSLSLDQVLVMFMPVEIFEAAKLNPVI